jgi:phage baseplate assembly protein W
MDLDRRGRTAEADESDHIRRSHRAGPDDVACERVNRPTFGSGLMQLVFALNSDALAAATLMSVQASLQQWLGTLIQVDGVEVNRDDATLSISVKYTIRRTQELRVQQFSRAV